MPTDADVLDYDDIRLIGYERAFQPYPETDYYTMCKDGLWGLMRSDGTEVLPCRAPQPLIECFIEGRRWHGYQDNLPWDEMLAEEKRINVFCGKAATACSARPTMAAPIWSLST